MPGVMGQTVEIRDTVELGDVFLIDTDRSLTGQDGQKITREDPGDSVPARLAAELFDLDPDIDYLFVLQNTISVRRRGGWDTEASDRVKQAMARFLRHYDD